MVVRPQLTCEEDLPPQAEPGLVLCLDTLPTDTRENIPDSESDKLPVEEPDLHCVPDETQTQHHPRSAGRAYGEGCSIYGKHCRPDWNP